MPALMRAVPAPALVAGAHGASVPNAYFGVRIDSAVNLMEAREYAALRRDERLRKALGEQQGMLNSLLDPALGLALDLRTVVRPETGALDVVVLGRAWAPDPSAAGQRAGAFTRQLTASLPRHVTASEIEDPDEVAALLLPFGANDPVDVLSITRRELIGQPARPDAKVAYYFSVLPFNWAEDDWIGLYSALSSLQTPLVLSVGLFPVVLPASFGQRLSTMATYYARLATEDSVRGGLYHGQQKLAPDSFAVDAQKVFSDYARRYVQRVYALRIAVMAPGMVPPGVAEAIAAAVSPSQAGAGSHLEHQRTISAYEIRRPRDEVERQVARWNVEAIDFCTYGGAAEIWQRPDPPSADLRVLCNLGDAKDVACAFRLPIAIDGTVPGFKVRRGHFGHVERYASDEPGIELGETGGAGSGMVLPLSSLTKHALIAGGTGSGKTTTILEILRQLWGDHGVPFLVIEPVNSDADDYRKLLDEPGFESLEVLTVGDESAHPLRFNPFEVPPDVLVAEHMANLLACFKAAFGLWEPLPSIYEEALNLTYMNAGILPTERPDGSDRDWPAAVEFMKAMGEATADLGYEGEVRSNIEAASIRRAQQLAVGTCASTFLTSRSHDMESLLDHPVVIELKTLGAGDEQSLMIAFLLNAMTEYYQAVRGASPTLRHVTVIEEAHRLLARPTGGGDQTTAQAKEKAAEGFANTLAENRKYGEGVIIAEQLPTKLVQDAVKNTNLKMMHRLTAEDERRYLGETMGFDDAQLRFATRLRTGEALVYADDFAEATMVSVRPKLEARAPGPIDARADPPFDACAVCRARCLYRGAALAVVRQTSNAKRIRIAAGALEEDGLTEEQIVERWAELTGTLREIVGAYRALPADEPGITDAAYCTFLHALATVNMHFSAEWAEAVASELGIEHTEAAGASA
jgi:hypothetical protein